MVVSLVFAQSKLDDAKNVENQKIDDLEAAETHYRRQYQRKHYQQRPVVVYPVYTGELNKKFPDVFVISIMSFVSLKLIEFEW